MDNLARKLTQGYFTLRELGVKYADIRRLTDKGYRIQTVKRDGKTHFAVLSANENVSLYISGAKRKPERLRWVEMSDIHAGSKQFDEIGLRRTLQKAVDEGYGTVRIAGDLTDGSGKLYHGQLANLRYWRMEDQANLLSEILMDYPLEYIACSGNHDLSWEKEGGGNPLLSIQEKVPDFTALDSCCADLIVGGVAHRMIHLGGKGAYALSYPGQVYIRNLLNSAGGGVTVRGKRYGIKFLHCGHLHTAVQYEAAGIIVTHSGNFAFANDFTTRLGMVGPQGARFVETTVADGEVLEYKSEFFKPRR